jgi:hypothetical protein
MECTRKVYHLVLLGFTQTSNAASTSATVEERVTYGHLSTYLGKKGERSSTVIAVANDVISKA